MQRRELLKAGAKLTWLAPTMTTLLAARLQPRWVLGMYNAYFVQKTREDQTYAGECNAACKTWYEIHGGFEDFKQELGGWWPFPSENGW